TVSACAGAAAKAAVTTIAARQRANIHPPVRRCKGSRAPRRVQWFRPIWGRLPREASPSPLALSQRKHRFCIAVTDLFHVLLGQIERLHDCDRGADVAPALFLVERTIGCEQHVIRPEERQSANRRRTRAGERGVAVEGLEIVERPLLQLL